MSTPTKKLVPKQFKIEDKYNPLPKPKGFLADIFGKKKRPLVNQDKL